MAMGVSMLQNISIFATNWGFRRNSQKLRSRSKQPLVCSLATARELLLLTTIAAMAKMPI
jgi:hypothetical protein